MSNTVQQPEAPPAPLTEREERLVELAANGNTATETAAVLGVCATTVYRALRKPAVRRAVAERRAEKWRPAAVEMRGGVTSSVRRLVHLVEHAEHESTQVRAAVAVIELALKFDQLVDEMPLRAELEALLQEKDQHP